MSSRSEHRLRGVFGVALLAVAGCGGVAHGGQSPPKREATLAAEILRASGVRGGLVVHLGCGEVNQILDLTVTVDLEAQKATLTLGDQRVEAPLDRRLEKVSYVGYAVHSVASEFSAIEIEGRRVGERQGSQPDEGHRMP